MNRQTQGVGQGLAGTQPYGTVEGARHIGNGRLGQHGQGVEPAPPSGVEYKTPTPHCTAISTKQEECLAPRAKGTLFCIGHLRQVEKKLAAEQKEKEVTEPQE